MPKTPSETPETLPLFELEPAPPQAAKGKAKNRGVMGFDPMQGLSPGAYRAETRRRQIAGGLFAAGERIVAELDQRAQARRLRAEGLSYREIGERLEIGAATAMRWCRWTPNETTILALEELLRGGGRRFQSVEALLRDLKRIP